MNQTRLKDELAIVTGADSGIGGADVVVTYMRDSEGARRTARDVEAAGRKAAVFQLSRTSKDF